MCNFKSGIVFRTGEVFTSPFTDSHEDLITLRGLKDDREARIQNWIRVEYRPDEKWDVFALSVDESETPAWFDDEMREKITNWFAALIANMTITGDAPLLLGGQYILRNANVSRLGAGTHVPAMLGTSQVGEILGTSQVGEMRGTSKVGEMRGTSKVGEMCETSKVGAMWGTSQVGVMRGTSQVGVMCETSQVGEMRGTSQVGEMCETSKVGAMCETSKAPKTTKDNRAK